MTEHRGPGRAIIVFGAAAALVVAATVAWETTPQLDERATQGPKPEVETPTAPPPAAVEPVHPETPPVEPAPAADPIVEPPAPGQAGSVASAPGAAGMRVAIDPETGELTVPTAEQIRTLELQAGGAPEWSDEGLETFVRPDGSVLVRLDERFMNYSVVRIGDDGRLHRACLHGSQDVGGFLACAHCGAATPEPVEE